MPASTLGFFAGGPIVVRIPMPTKEEGGEEQGNSLQTASTRGMCIVALGFLLVASFGIVVWYFIMEE